MRLKSPWIGAGIVATAAAIVATNAASSPFPHHGGVESRASGGASGDLRLPGAMVIATPPSLNEIVDIILGESASTSGDTLQSRIAAMLRERTPDAGRAAHIATALVREGRRSNIGAMLLAGVLMTENPDLEPRATSAVGARGLMQVMPFHAGRWGCPSNDLFDIDSNICHGVRILADNLRHSRNLPAALLKYNGCVRGTNTPDCHRYAAIVYRHARKTTIGPGGKVTAATPFSKTD